MGNPALEFARKGFPVFPCSLDKKPMTPHGFLDATTDPEQINIWWSEHPDASIGLVTGFKSKMAVLDVDPRHEGDDTLIELEKKHGKIPDTVRAITGGGGTHYFFYLDSPMPSRNGFAPGLDWKADGGYVIVPPSPHPSGRRYAWDLGTIELVRAPVPTWLRALVVPPSQTAGGSLPAAKIPEKIPSGNRNQSLFSLAGSMRKRGCNQQEILAALSEMNRRCDPPLDHSEIVALSKSVCRYAPDVDLNKTEHTAAELGIKGWSAERKTLGELINEEIPTLTWLVDRILVAESVGWIGGPPKHGKSLVGLNLALSVACGVPFLGEFETTKGRTLYISEEDPKRIVYQRVKRMLAGFPRDYPPPAADDFSVVCRSGFQLDQADRVAWLKREIATYRPKLVVADVFARLHHSDVNKADEMCEIIEVLDGLRMEFGVTIQVVTHFKKLQDGQDTSSPGQLMSGSVALHAFSECSMYLLKKDGKSRLYFEAKEFEAIKDMELLIDGREGEEEDGPIILRVEKLPEDTTAIGARNRDLALAALMSAWQRLGQPSLGVPTMEILDDLGRMGGKFGRRTLQRHLQACGLIPVVMGRGADGGTSLFYHPSKTENSSGGQSTT